MSEVQVRNAAWGLALFIIAMSSCNTCASMDAIQRDVKLIRQAIEKQQEPTK